MDQAKIPPSTGFQQQQPPVIMPPPPGAVPYTPANHDSWISYNQGYNQGFVNGYNAGLMRHRFKNKGFRKQKTANTQTRQTESGQEYEILNNVHTSS